ncbi:MAG: hypothetical protein EBR55_02175 [Chitinophagia bacterium]|nr:hypothetical protein [Chitinophagia bacterium]
MGILITSLITFPENAYATCVNYIESQTIAAAYEGDEVPTVHTMDTCGGDDISYQIPIATTITFDGVQYSNIYATTNSVITFGQPDGTYWTYPSTPSISLYSMDWVTGWYNAPDTLNISYSEGGFQLDLEVIPFGQWNTPTPTNINIIVAITNTGGISVAYSYQGPEYPNLRTGVRLHDGSIVSLEAWGATQIQSGSAMPTLAPEPVSTPIAGPTPTPSPTPLTPEQQQTQNTQNIATANDVAAINELIVAAADAISSDVIEPSPEPTPTPEITADPNIIVVEPEIITPEDPQFPDNIDEQTQPDNTNPTPEPETTPTAIPDPEPSAEPSVETLSQPEDTNQDQIFQPSVDLVQNPDKNPFINTSISDFISEEELKKLNSVISVNDAKLLGKLVESNPDIKQAIIEFSTRAEENKDAFMPYTVADAITEVQTEKLLENPVGALTSVFTDIDLKTLTSPTEWGKDMTDDQREKVQEIVVPVIIASNIVAAAMTRRK